MNALGVFIAYPWLALLPGVGFAALATRRRRTRTWIAAVAWFLYAAYETAMLHRILCSGECNIRVDLLLLYPALLVLSVVAALSRGRMGRAEA